MLVVVYLLLSFLLIHSAKYPVPFPMTLLNGASGVTEAIDSATWGKYSTIFSANPICLDLISSTFPSSVTTSSCFRPLAVANRKYEKAMSLIKKVLSIVPDDSRAILVEGFILFKSNKYDDALSRFDHILQRNEFNIDAWYYKGAVKTAVKDYDDALRCYEEAIEINPKFAEAYNAKADVLFRKKEKQKAIDEVKKAIEIDPALASAPENLTKLIVSTENQRHEFMHFG